MKVRGGSFNAVSRRNRRNFLKVEAWQVWIPPIGTRRSDPKGANPLAGEEAVSNYLVGIDHLGIGVVEYVEDVGQLIIEVVYSLFDTCRVIHFS